MRSAFEVENVWITPDAEKLIAHIARVSNPKNQDKDSTAPRLLKYLISHKHWSPFEMVSACYSIKTSRAIGEQILRHRSFSFQVFSQRYAEVPEIMPVEMRAQAKKNRQSSEDVFDPFIQTDPYYDPDKGEYASEMIIYHFEQIEWLYTHLLEAGVAKETARMILPMASQTHIYMAGTLRSWIHYAEIRTSEDVQKEHRDIANAIKKDLIIRFPVVSTALGWI